MIMNTFQINKEKSQIVSTVVYRNKFAKQKKM